MITCVSCGHREFEGALFCTECGARLRATADLFTQALPRDAIPQPQGTTATSAAHEEVAARMVELVLLEQEGVIPLFPGQHVVLGRAVKDQPPPDLDLSPFGGYRAGVSRRHALLQFDGRRLSITDLQSSNGTWVNEQRIPPRQPVWLRHGDVLRLGKMKFQVVFRQGGE